jgi:hypothetical protein
MSWGGTHLLAVEGASTQQLRGRCRAVIAGPTPVGAGGAEV